MKIACPSCNAQYAVPEIVLTARRKMRCARCGSEWVPADLAAPEPAPPVALPEAEPVAGVPEEMPAAPPPMEEVVPAPPMVPVVPAHVETMAEPAHAKETLPQAQEIAAGVPAHEDAVPVMAPAELPLAEPVFLDEPPPPPPPPRRAVRPEPPIGVRTRFPDPVAIVVPPAVQGPPVLAWAASIAVLVVVVALAVIYRAPIMKAWPPSVRLFAGLGLGEG